LTNNQQFVIFLFLAI